MARSCTCEKIFDEMRSARFRSLVTNERMLWVDIVTLLHRDGIPALRVGGKVIEPRALLRLLDRDEGETVEELTVKIETLVERGLLAREEDGAISCPMLAQAQTRAEINRVNGAKGGRPRKDGAPLATRPRLEVIQGGAAQVLPPGGKGESDMATRANSAPSQPPQGDDEIDREWKRLVPLAARWAGLSDKPGNWNSSVVRDWIIKGADEALIKHVIREKTSDRVYSFAYFTRAIMAALTERNAPPPPLWEREWEKAYRLWELTRKGECPRTKDFKAKYGVAA